MTQGDETRKMIQVPEGSALVELDHTGEEAKIAAEANRLLDSLPMEFRPLANVPGRNRKEKRTYRKLATLAERGTIRKHAAMRLKRMYVELVRVGNIRKPNK